MINWRKTEECEQEEYEEVLAHRRRQERIREEQAEEDYWFRQMQHECELAKQAELYYAEQAQAYYLCLHVVHILKCYLSELLDKQEENNG